MFFTQVLGSRLRVHLVVGFIFSVMSMLAFAENDAQFLSLHQAVEKTLLHNPQLHQFAVKKTDLLARGKTSALKPALTVGIEVENVAGSGDMSGTSVAETTLALSSVIELGGKHSARVSVADAQLQAFEVQRQVFTLDVLGELAQVFIQALEVQARISLANEAYALAESTLAIVKNRSQQGAAPESEVRRAAAAYAKTELQLQALQQQHQRLLIKLSAYWGETSPSWTRLMGDLYAFGKVSSFESLYERAQAAPAITQFASKARLKKAEVLLAKTQSSVDLGWQLGARRFEESGDTAFTAGVSMPLFNGSRNQGALQSAIAAENEVVYERQTALLKLHVQLFAAYSQRQQHVAAVEMFRTTILPDLNTALASTQKAYESGRYSYQDWIAAQQELLEAKQSLIENAAAASLNQAVIEQLIAEPLYSPAGQAQ